MSVPRDVAHPADRAACRGELASALEEPSKASYWVAGAALVALAASMWWLRRWAKRHEGL